jgi:hypothetical protein
MKKKTIQITLSVITGIENYTLCEFISQLIQNSVLGSAEYKLDMTETKVTKSEDI